MGPRLDSYPAELLLPQIFGTSSQVWPRSDSCSVPNLPLQEMPHSLAPIKGGTQATSVLSSPWGEAAEPSAVHSRSEGRGKALPFPGRARRVRTGSAMLTHSGLGSPMAPASPTSMLVGKALGWAHLRRGPSPLNPTCLRQRATLVPPHTQPCLCGLQTTICGQKLSWLAEKRGARVMPDPGRSGDSCWLLLGEAFKLTQPI